MWLIDLLSPVPATGPAQQMKPNTLENINKNIDFTFTNGGIIGLY